MSELNKIKQATEPIKEFHVPNRVVSGNDMANDHNKIVLNFNENGGIIGDSVFPNVKDMQEAVQAFVNNNKDNPNVYNPFDHDGKPKDESSLITAYNIGLALSHWDDIVAKHGDKIHEVAERVGDNYNNSALALGAGAYIADSQGLDDKSVNLILDKSVNDYGFVSSYKMNDAREMFAYGYNHDEVDFILDKSDKTRDGVMYHMNDDGDFLKKDEIEMLSSVTSRHAMTEVVDMIRGNEYHNQEIKDVISASNLYYESLWDNDNKTNNFLKMADFMDDVKAIKYYETEKYDIQRMEHPEIKQTDNQINGIVFGEDRLTNLVKDYLNNPSEPNIMLHYHHKGLEPEASKEMPEIPKPEKVVVDFEHIKIPSGLIDGPHDSKYGKYDIISVPFEDKFGKMTVSDSLVDRNGKTAVLSLPSDRDRTVQFYDKETKEKTSETFNVSDLKDIYNKNWERLNARNKSLDSKFEATQEFLANKFDSPEV
jgi:hypothetical protein